LGECQTPLFKRGLRVAQIDTAEHRNAFGHSRASKIEVEITYDAENWSVRVRDNGSGIDPKTSGGGNQGHWAEPETEAMVSVHAQYQRKGKIGTWQSHRRSGFWWWTTILSCDPESQR